MTRGELIGRVAVIYLKDQLNSEPEGPVRFCMVGFGRILTTEVAKAVIADSELFSHLDVRIHRDLSVDSEIPPEIVTEETAAHWRNKQITSSDKRCILFAISTDELQKVGESIGTLSKLQTDHLLERYDYWLEAVHLGGDQLQERERECLNVSLGAARNTYAIQNIEIFSDYVLKVTEFITQGKRVEHALDMALPALQLPLWAGGFKMSDDFTKRFNYLQKNVRPMLALENSEGDSIIDQSRLNFDELKNELELEEIEIIEAFLNATNLSLGQWRKEQEDLVNLDWRRIHRIFDGLEKTTKQTLGQETIDFFQDNFPEDIEGEEQDFLRQSLSPPSKDPTDEAKEFFNTHGERLSKDKKLYSRWERYIYRPEEYEDFIEALIATLQRLRNISSEKTDSVSLKISILGNPNKKLFWEEKNGAIMRYFAFQSHGFASLFEEFVTFDFGKLHDYYLPEEPYGELLQKESRRKDACRLRFEMILSYDGTTVEEAKAVFFWKMRPDSIPTALPLDLWRIANQAQSHALLSTADVSRQISGAKGQIQRVDLRDTNTLHDVDSGNRGVLVNPNRGHIYQLFKDELRGLVSRGIVTGPQEVEILNSMDNFLESYTKAIRDWVNVGGSGIASHNFLEQANDYEKLLSTLRENANNDLSCDLLWKLVLRIGIANIGGGEETAIITPWQPLRMAELHVKFQQAAELVTDVLKSDLEDVYKADIYYSQRLQEFKSAYYPEVCIWVEDNESKLLVLTNNLGGYSLAESPSHEYLEGSDKVLGDADSHAAAHRFAEISERYLALLPHEKSNFSVVLFNAESKALPKALIDELSEKVEQESDLRCDLFLTHKDQGRLRQIYE
ncbi:MAG: DNA translocase FtsK, partial [Candidatus Dadabacteria bacterium]|nr:DNA translocase FtsK [Candidatus Dadabacteria bacterium]